MDNDMSEFCTFFELIMTIHRFKNEKSPKQCIFQWTELPIHFSEICNLI